MPKQIIKKYLPHRDKILALPGLNYFEKLLTDPAFWHLNRRSVSVATAIGLFCAFIPLPGQMVLGITLAIGMRVNLPIVIALIWITNPLTMAPVFLLAYKLGQLILHTPPIDFNLEISWHWVTHELTRVWQPLLFGSLLMAVSASSIGYTLMNWLWRRTVRKRWNRRRNK